MVEVGLQLEHSSVTLSVRDSGCGMNEQELQQVFKRFYRADSSRSDHGSFGLGLSIAQAIAQAHGGVIRAESDKRSTRFTVTLPLSRT